MAVKDNEKNKEYVANTEKQQEQLWDMKNI